MNGLHGKTGTGDRDRKRWTSGVIISLLFHVLLFSLVLFVPDSMPTRRIGGMPVYEVNLVEMPTQKRSETASKASVETSGPEVSSSKASPAARRITPPAQEEKPVIIGKRVVERKKEEEKKIRKPPKPKVSPSKLIDGAVSRIEKKVKAKKSDHLAQALSKIEKKAREEGEGVPGRGGAEDGITIRMYQLAVEEQIKSNWSYPVALMDSKKLKNLEAIVLVKVRQDGTILKSWLTKRSASAIFDGSVLKAVERSDPLPPFPEGYKRSTDEIEIKFDLSELEEF